MGEPLTEQEVEEIIKEVDVDGQLIMFMYFENIYIFQVTVKLIMKNSSK